MGADMKTWQSSWDIPAHVYNKYRQTCYPKQQQTCKRIRVKGQHVLHGKYVLILVVALCILDCCLVITELILDIHAVKDALSTIQHNADYLGSDYASSHSNSSYETTDTYPVTDRAPDTAHSVHRRASANGHDIPLTMEIAHGCHFASVAILGVLLVYVIFKVVFFGKEMFSKKLEMFDAFVVLASFALDLAFLDGVTNGPIENTAFILSFFVPWRVLRVVNSLVVAILDREHYKLVVIYKSKKRVELSLDEVRDELHEALNRVKKLKELALKGGVEEWKVNLCLVQASKNDGKKNALSSFASFTFGAMTDKNSNSKKRSNGVTSKKTIRIPQLLEEEEPKKTKPEDKEVTPPEFKENETTTTDTPEAGHPKSLSGDSALSLSLDAEQNDINSGTVETFENPDVEQTTPNNTELAQQTTPNNTKLAQQTTHNNLEKGNQTRPNKTEQTQHVTVVNIPENPEQSNNKKQDHTAIQISFPASTSEKTPVKDKSNSGDTEQSGYDNPAFVADDCNTKL